MTDHWHKSSHSGGNGGNCVEIKEGVATAVRDTRNRELCRLEFSAGEWAITLHALTL
ncbi:DUF397 domain-containing protein [Nocardiopsis sp. CC223A]|uniref:DUF397 domain-containing protein n=1 Tax=Nocardiopsis sp. CC223A TaxID=3044051 RepID=UPI00278C7B9C|nr:DUF397 domain-containing protein [Nocardiopsis sp. CC223A]